MLTRSRHLLATIALAASLTWRASPAFAQAPSDLDAFADRVLATFEVPGAAVAIVKDRKVVVARGYGVKELGKPDPVADSTLFGIASNTKLFTATALGMLVDEGRLEWDAPVLRYLPWFQMWDPYVTRELTVRDLLVHRSGLGLGAGDLLWWPPSTYDRKEIARRLRFVQPATSFRSAYAYDNVLYLVAGEVLEAVSGETWEDFVAGRILARVGMEDSNVRHSAAGAGRDAATPHARVEGVVRPVRPFASDNTNPAGGINASARDVAKWMLLRLADGRLPDGSRLYSPETARELTTLVTPIPIAPLPPELAAQETHFNGYALGVRVQDYRGRWMVSHTGGLPGYVSRITLLPELGLGVAVLTNQESGEAFNALTYHVLDHYLGAEDTDWLEAYRAVKARADRRLAESRQAAASARDAASRPSLPLDDYAGTYRDAWYGDVTILEEEGGLVLRFTRTPALVGDLEHWQYDTFVVRWRDRELRADAYVTFTLDPSGRVARARMLPASEAVDFSFDFQDLHLTPVPPR